MLIQKIVYSFEYLWAVIMVVCLIRGIYRVTLFASNESKTTILLPTKRSFFYSMCFLYPTNRAYALIKKCWQKWDFFLPFCRTDRKNKQFHVHFTKRGRGEKPILLHFIPVFTITYLDALVVVGQKGSKAVVAAKLGMAVAEEVDSLLCWQLLFSSVQPNQPCCYVFLFSILFYHYVVRFRTLPFCWFCCSMFCNLSPCFPASFLRFQSKREF